MVFLVKDNKFGTNEVYSTNSGDDNVSFICESDLVTLKINELEIRFDMVEAFRIWTQEIQRKKNEDTVVY